MGDGLGNEELFMGDQVIKEIHEKIDTDIRSLGINFFFTLQLNNLHYEIAQILLSNNPEKAYWIQEIKSNSNYVLDGAFVKYLDSFI